IVISQPFAVGRFEITRDQYAAFVAASSQEVADRCWTLEGNNPEERSGRSFRNPGFIQTSAHPVVCINWAEARAYVEWLTKTTAKPYYLLSEAEWEYMARGGTTTRYHFGNDEKEVCKFANGADQFSKMANLPATWNYVDCLDKHVYTAPVGSYEKNGF